ncbi:hypothetical protein J6590_071935 [Homalodisca vitripennis]|nr:hypothetical protein J6590_071935 [Homalodisca vitripennis]
MSGHFDRILTLTVSKGCQPTADELTCEHETLTSLTTLKPPVKLVRKKRHLIPIARFFTVLAKSSE